MKVIISFLAGAFVVTAFFALTALAAGGIKSAAFNDNKIGLNGYDINLGGEKMISVIAEGATNAENYIPMRKALEEMGFRVEWNERLNAVIITDK